MNNRLGILLFALALQATATTPNEQMEIEQLYRRGLTGDKAAVESCIVKLEAVLKSDPQNQLARAYLGSAYTLRSRDLGFGPKKLRVLKEGVAVMNQAVAAAHDDPKVRLIRALTTEALPSFFGYPAESRKDFIVLAQMAKDHPERLSAADLRTIRDHLDTNEAQR